MYMKEVKTKQLNFEPPFKKFIIILTLFLMSLLPKSQIIVDELEVGSCPTY